MNPLILAWKQFSIKKKVLIALGAFLAVAVFVIVLRIAFSNDTRPAFARAGIVNLYYSMTASREVREATYIQAGQTGVRSFILNSTAGAVPANELEGKYVVDAAHTKDHSALILVALDSGAFTVTLDGTMLPRNDAQKMNLSISPEGTQVAYAEAPKLPPVKKGNALPKDRIGEWSVVVVGASGVHNVGKGFAAFFASETTLLRFTTQGLFETNLVTGAEKAISEFSIPSANSFAAAQSPDHKLLAWTNPKTGVTLLYHIEQMKVMTYIPVASYQFKSTGKIALSNTALYQIIVTEQGTRIEEHSIDGKNTTKVVKSFPPGVLINKMIP
jgi:hypothetical protein